MRIQGHIHILRCRTGFTLMEILITMSIIGIAAVITAPAFMSLAPSMALKSASRDLYANLQIAKIQAIKDNSNIDILFTGSYYFQDTDASGAWTAAATDTFTDKNGDGVYSKGEPFVDADADGMYSGEITYSLADYGYGIRYGFGTAPTDVDGNPFNANSQATQVTFNSRGLATVTPLPTSKIYLDFLEPDNVTTSINCYAVETTIAGSLRTRMFNGSQWR